MVIELCELFENFELTSYQLSVFHCFSVCVFSFHFVYCFLWVWDNVSLLQPYLSWFYYYCYYLLLLFFWYSLMCFLILLPKITARSIPRKFWNFLSRGSWFQGYGYILHTFYEFSSCLLHMETPFDQHQLLQRLLFVHYKLWCMKPSVFPQLVMLMGRFL